MSFYLWLGSLDWLLFMPPYPNRKHVPTSYTKPCIKKELLSSLFLSWCCCVLLVWDNEWEENKYATNTHRHTTNKRKCMWITILHIISYYIILQYISSSIINNQNNTNNYLQYSSLYSTTCMPIISYVYVVHIIVYRSRIYCFVFISVIPISN